jgi:tetratricopeptide (TPR) repeat protein
MDNLENTYYWLKRDGDPFAQHALRILVQQMHTMVKQNKTSEAIALMEEAQFISKQVGDALVQAQVRLECARADYNLKRADEAMQDLTDAIQLLKARAGLHGTYKYYNSVAHWMLGNLLLKMPGQRKAALAAWQYSLDAFESLVALAAYENSDPAWYQDRCAEMRQALEKEIRAASVKPVQPVAPAPKTAKFKFPISTLFSGNLKSIPVAGEIPAGGFGPSGIDPYRLETLKLDPSMDEFVIGGQPHRLVNLRGSPGVTQLVSSNTYFILKVNGDSMDKVLIDPGDYVLLRQQDSADHNDVVAAEIVHVDTQATLKLFVRTASSIELQPRSNNPSHQKFTFNQQSGGFHVRGVMLGVFKK